MTRRRFQISLGFLLLFLGVLQFGCSRSGRPFALPGMLAFRLTENPVTLDPARVVDVTGGELVTKIYSGLVRFDSQFRIVPDLAETVTLLDEGRRYRFVLRKNLTFSNGHPLTTEDVCFSIRRVMDPLQVSPRRWVLDKIEGAKAYAEGKVASISGLQVLDVHTLDIILEEPFNPFLSLLTMPAAMIVSKQYVVQSDTDMDHAPLGAGPYVLDSWRADVRLKLVPNSRYPVSDLPLPSLIYRIIPEEATAVGMMATGELDVMKTPNQQVQALKERFTHQTFIPVAELNTYYLGFDHRKSYMDLPLKKSVAHLVNRPAWIQSILGGQGVPAQTPVPPALLQNPPEIHLPVYSLEAARNVFQQSLARNRELILLSASSREALAVVSILQDGIRLIGGRAKIVTLDWSAFKEAMLKGEGDIFYLSWWADYADPENFLYPTFHSSNHGGAGNRVYFSDALMDGWLKKLQMAPTALGQSEALKVILDRVGQELPWVPLWHKTAVYQISPRVGGFQGAPMYSMDKGLQLFLREGDHKV